eukprot:7269659-Alexandrium_andersonii.AAC.1
MFPEQLKEARGHGVLDTGVGCFVVILAQVWKLDAREVEGASGVVKRIGQIAPRISWDLMASRLTIKKAMPSVKQKYTSYMDFARTLVCVTLCCG